MHLFRLPILPLWPLILAQTQRNNTLYRPTTSKAVHLPRESQRSPSLWAHCCKNFKNFQTVAETLESNKLVPTVTRWDRHADNWLCRMSRCYCHLEGKFYYAAIQTSQSVLGTIAEGRIPMEYTYIYLSEAFFAILHAPGFLVSPY